VSSIGSRPRVLDLKRALTTINADVLFLQEVQGRHDRLAARYAARWPAQAQYDFLAGENQQAAYGMNAVYDYGHHGNALLSSFPIASFTNQNVSDHAYESRGILHCTIEAPSSTIHCYVVHLGLFGGSRKRQTKALIEAVGDTSPAGAPIIIAGDFNDWGNQLGASMRHDLGVCEVFDEHVGAARLGRHLHPFVRRNTPTRIQPARTFPAMLPWLRLDRIYVRGFKVESAQVLGGAPWTRLSDHAPIIATLDLPIDLKQ
jgi:endonuclease/exonuclease/phosphatase family metal-dependent hydrolase